ncbi:MAG: glycosyltransferase [Patescibacteria group bacterium]
MKTLSAKPLVSVIVNTVDRPEDLRRCLEAVLNQSYRNFEVVVVNNGVGAESRQQLAEMKIKYQILNLKFRVVEDGTKKLSYLFNVGWKNASDAAEIFAYAADDTEPDKDWLQHIVSYLVDNQKCGGVSGPTLSTTQPPGEMFALYDLMKKKLLTRVVLRLYEYFVMEDKTFAPGHWPESGAFTMGAGIPLPEIKEPIEIDLLTSGNMGVKRAAMESINGFDEHFYFNHADGDLFIRLNKAGWKLVFHPGVKVLHHMRFGPTRYPEIMGRDTAFYYLKDVRPKSLRGWIGLKINLCVFLTYWIFKAWQTKNKKQLNGLTGFAIGIRDFFLTSTPERNELIKTLAVIGGFILLMAQAFRNIHLSGMLAYGDATPFPFTAEAAFRTFFAAWDPRSPGISLPQIPVLSSLTFFEGVLITLLAGHAVAAQWLFHWLPIPLSFISLYYVIGKFSLSRTSKFFAAFLYSANLVAVGETTGGFEGSLYVQAIFPLLLLYLYEFYLSGRFNPRIWVKFSVLLSAAYLLSDHVFIFLFPFALLSALLLIIRGRLKSVLIFWLSSALLVILLTLFHTFYYASLALPFFSGGLRPDVLKFLFQNVHDTYNHVTTGSALRVGSFYYQNIFGTSVWWERLGTILPLTAFGWIFFPANWKRPRFLSGLSLSLLAVITLYFLDNARENLNDLFLRFPFLFRFRNPSRPWLFLTLNYAFLSALTIDGARRLIETGIFIKIKRFRYGLYYLGFAILLLGLAYYYRPFFSGDFTMGRNRGSSAVISSRYRQIGKWLAEQQKKDGPFRTLWLPWNHEETEVKLYWLDPYAYAVPINYGAYTQSKYLENIVNVYQGITAEKFNEIAGALAEAGVKYVILNTKSKETGRALYRYDYQTPWLLGVWGDWERIVGDVPELRFVGEVGGFQIYENTLFNHQRVDLVKAGLYPPDGDKRQTVRNLLILITFLSWGGVVISWRNVNREVNTHENSSS